MAVPTGYAGEPASLAAAPAEPPLSLVAVDGAHTAAATAVSAASTVSLRSRYDGGDPSVRWQHAGAGRGRGGARCYGRPPSTIHPSGGTRRRWRGRKGELGGSSSEGARRRARSSRIGEKNVPVHGDFFGVRNQRARLDACLAGGRRPCDVSVQDWLFEGGAGWQAGRGRPVEEAVQRCHRDRARRRGSDGHTIPDDFFLLEHLPRVSGLRPLCCDRFML